MSPVLDLQRQLRELGRIRMGDKGGNNGAQRRLDKFRLTSPSQGILNAAAAVYGGQVREWSGAPDPPQFELYTEREVITVAIPPMDEPFSQWYELWSAGGCQRRCDGQTAMVAYDNGLRERSCVCKAEGQEGKDRECNLTTRAPFILPEVPGIGVWRLESKGYNVATSLTGTLQYLSMQASQGVYIEAELRLVNRSKRVPGQPTHRWVEPVLDTPTTTIGQLMGGAPAGPAPSLTAGTRPALPAAAAPPNGEAAGFDDPAPAAPSGRPGWGSAPEPPSGEAAQREDPNPPISPQRRGALFAFAKEREVPPPAVRGIARMMLGHGVSEMTADEVDRLKKGIEKFSASDESRAKVVEWMAEHAPDLRRELDKTAEPAA